MWLRNKKKQPPGPRASLAVAGKVPYKPALREGGGGDGGPREGGERGTRTWTCAAAAARWAFQLASAPLVQTGGSRMYVCIVCTNVGKVGR